MEEKDQQRSDLDRLAVLLPYWLHHNKDHIRDQEEWLRKAERGGLQSIADELRKAIDHLQEGNRHIERASSRVQHGKASDAAETVSTKQSHISKSGTPGQNITPLTLDRIGVIRAPYTDSAPYQPLPDAEGDFRIVVDSGYRGGLLDLDRFHYIYALYWVHRVTKPLSMAVRPP